MGDNPEVEVLVEIDDEGRSTGVEAEDEASEERIEEPFDPAEIDVVTRTMTVDLLLSRLRRGVLDLAPDFQRIAGIWNIDNQSKLIESLLLRIPLPTFYAAEVGEESWAIVDGIQRLSTIARFVAPDLIDSPPLRLRGLEYLERYEGLTYQKLPAALQTRINETELIVHLIRSGTPEPVMFNIFARLNTGGRPLTPQELRHALIPGRSRSLLRELAESDAFIDATQGSVKPTRMADREMVLRFLAFRLVEPADYVTGDLDAFLRSTMRLVNDLPVPQIEALEYDFTRAMRAAQEVFGVHAFRKRYRETYGRLPVNKPLFEAEAIGLAKLSDGELDKLRNHTDQVEERFFDLMEDSTFQDSISYATGDVTKVQFRFAAVEKMLRDEASL
jgi:hypothetical protein